MKRVDVVIRAVEVDAAVDWIISTVGASAAHSEGPEDCPLCVGIAMLKQARRFDAAEVPF